MDRHRLSASLPGGCLVAILLALASPFAAQESPSRDGGQPLSVDVTVVDREGRPIPGVRPEEFELTVDGSQRTVGSADFVSLALVTAPDTAGLPAAFYTPNGWTAAGRLVVLVIDQGHIRAGAKRAVFAAASGFLERLSPADRVALVTMPGGGPMVNPTTDRALIREALELSAGQAQRARSTHNLGLAEALALEEGDIGRWDLVLQRECDDRTADQNLRAQCHQSLDQDARALIASTKQASLQAVEGLRQVFAWLASMPGPKSVVLLTEGLISGTPRNPIAIVNTQSVREAAAASQASFYVLHLQARLFEMTDGRLAPSGAEDESLNRQGLDMLASQVRGALFPVNSNGDLALARVASETSAYYLLSFQPRPEERDGKPHRLAVHVRRPGAVVRVQSDLVARPVPAAARTREQQLLEALRSPVPVRELPLSVATYAVSAADGTTRVILSAAIDRGVQASREMDLGFIVMDERGAIVANSVDASTLQPAGQGANARLHYTTSWNATPGSYILKFAAMDPGRRLGVIEHRLSVPAPREGAPTAGDLLLFDGPVSSQPTADGLVTSETLSLRLEFYGTPFPAGTGVSMEIRSPSSEAALVRGDAPVSTQPHAKRAVAEATLGLALLQAGDYMAQAVATTPDGGRMVVARPFRREIPALPVPGGPPASGREPARGSPSGAALARATEYVDKYVETLSTVVCEERYEQTSQRQTSAEWLLSRPLESVHRTLVSDLVFVRLPGTGEWSTFRDVYSVDGKPIRDRQDRLMDLFVKPHGDRWRQVARIREESARHNIGGARRDINLPTFALQFLLPHVRSHFAFKPDGRKKIDGVETEVFAYEENARPTLILGRNDEDLPASGHVWVDPSDGTVVRISLETRAKEGKTLITVSFGRNEQLGMWLPREMEERHSLPGEQVSGRATYSNFRQFKVETSEQIK